MTPSCTASSGTRERSLRCSGHCYFFTTQTLQKLYEAAGFSLKRIDYVGRSLTIERLAYNFDVVTGRRWMAPLARRLALHRVHVYLNARDMQRVVVRKAVSTDHRPTTNEVRR